MQTQYASQTTASASESNGVYSNFRATLTLQAKPGTVFTDRPDYIVAHEYGHVWTLYHLYMSQHGDMTTYLVAPRPCDRPPVSARPTTGRRTR